MEILDDIRDLPRTDFVKIVAWWVVGTRGVNTVVGEDDQVVERVLASKYHLH